MKVSCPRVIIAGTGSGVGKTSVTLALIAALKKRGLSVQSFKIGPDYLDPTYLSIASGRPCYNLDGWMTGADYVRELFADRVAAADVAVIEGVMGLFDGSDPVGPEGSTAEIAAWLNAPILLLVDAYGVARSFAAVVKGYTEFQPELNVAGVIANHCGSEKHASWLGTSLSAFGLPGLVGALPRGCFPELPSRHLGLITADSRNLTDSVISALADALERRVDVDAIWNIARTATSLDIDAPKQKIANGGKRVRLGLAFDEAFHFYYPDNLEALEQAGCELIRFSPLHQESLPEALDAIYMGGGYPEEHAETLASNKTMLDSIRSFAASGRPVYAECGGLMYLGQGIERTDGKRFELVGLVPAWTRMLGRLKSLGYVEVTLAEDSLFGKRGANFRGHEFHYSELLEDPSGRDGWRSVYRIARRRVDAVASEGFQYGKTLASYVHAHFASKPELVNYFVSLCEAAKMKESYGSMTDNPKRVDAPHRPIIYDLYDEPMTGEAIETRSFEIIEREVPSRAFTAEQWQVVRRMLHATADFGLLDQIRFSADAILAARSALRAGAPIFVDSNMIRSGISLARLKTVCGKYNSQSLICHVADDDVAAAARETGLPRSLYAVRKAKSSLRDGIAVFGNAPVALMELNRFIVEESIRPAFVIAMPVGFVHVTESKDEFTALGVPYVAVAGRRGGSPLAVSALHALCALAIETE